MIVRVWHPSGNLYVYKSCMRVYVADTLFKQLQYEVNWQQPAGMPRFTCFMSDCKCPYGYSRFSIEARPWHKNLRAVLRNVAKSLKINIDFNCANLNLYHGTQQSVDWHSDNEWKMFGHNPTILSISLGSTRKFCVRPCNDVRNVITYTLDHGDVCIMQGNLQKTHQHQVPKEYYKDPDSVRINITARVITNCTCGHSPVSEWSYPFSTYQPGVS